MSNLDGFRVIDLTDEKGWFCTRLLADMGAEVIRIERPGTPVAQNPSNAGKHAISLDIVNVKGRKLFRQLIKDADVLVESLPPGYLDSLGLGYNGLSQGNCRLIMASISPYGQTGPYRDYKSSDLVASAMGGQAYVCGEPGKPPLKPPGPQPYYTASLFAANGVLLALLARHTSDRGQYIDISVHECVAGTLDHVLVRYLYQGIVAERQGNLYWNQSFRIFPCRDGYILLSWSRNWETLVEWMDSEGMAEDLREPRWLDESERQRHSGHIIEVLQKWTRSHNVDELVETGQLMRFPWAKVDSIPEVVESPQMSERDFFVEVVDPETRAHYKIPGAPMKMSASPWQINPLIPQAGEFNHEIFGNRMGFTDSEIAILQGEKVI